MAKAQKQRGYSLMELMAALAIIAGISLTLVEGLRFGGRTMIRAETLQQDAADILSTRRVLGEWLGNAQGQPTADNETISFKGDASVMRFKTLAPAFPTARGFYDITLRIERKPRDGFQLRIFRKADWSEEEPYEGVLLESQDNISFSYLGDANWREEWAKEKKPPNFVRLSIGSAQPLIFPVLSQVSIACLSSRDGSQVQMSDACG